MSYGQPPGFNPPPYGYGPPPGAMPPPNPMNPMGPMGPMGTPPQGPQQRSHGLAIASLVTGILALFPGCCCGLFGIPLSIIALVMGIVSIQQINASGGQLGGKNMALAGTILGGVAIGIDVLAFFLNAGAEIMKSMHV
jgi:hypothetical protein